jgi:nitrate reductase NapE component
MKLHARNRLTIGTDDERTSFHFIFFLLALTFFITPIRAVAAMEQYGFDSWLEGWAPTTNTTMQAITNVVQSPATNAAWFGEGANSLRIECDIRTNANKNLGRVSVDLRKDLGFSIPVPANLSNLLFRYKMIWPTGGNGARGTNRYRLFTADVSGQYQYYGWYNVGTNGLYTDAGFYVSATNGTEDAGYDPCRIVSVGMDVAPGVGSTGVYNGPVFIESIQFDAPPALCVTPTNQKYTFDSGSEAFQLQTWWDSQAITNL